MARRGDSVIGIDLGKHVFKGVSLRRKSDSRFVLTSFASREVPEELQRADELGAADQTAAEGARRQRQRLRHRHFRSDLASAHHRTTEHAGRSASQRPAPEWPRSCSTRNAKISSSMSRRSPPTRQRADDRSQRKVRQRRGSEQLSRPKPNIWSAECCAPLVKQISEAMSKTRVPADILQLAPVCSFNAFEFAYPEIFNNDAFLLLDMGHLQSTVLIGSKGELVLVRSIDYGGKALTQALTADGALDAKAAWVMIQRRRRRHGRNLPRLRSTVSPPKCAIRSDSSKDNAKKASTAFLFPAVWLAPKRFCRR